MHTMEQLLELLDDDLQDALEDGDELLERMAPTRRTDDSSQALAEMNAAYQQFTERVAAANAEQRGIRTRDYHTEMTRRYEDKFMAVFRSETGGRNG